ncbi:MAG: response regulator transcription factor [Nitrospirae bacterium]|nr:response regulator transcription factor [Nitrospirota bacterium]MBF0542485.1 response regulator transcription factor [Nitrospirota bacterium]
MLNVLIADDHAIVREGMRQILSSTSDINLTAEASDGIEMLSMIRKKKFDVILMDISMPGLNGLDALKQLKTEFPSLPVLILSMYPEEQYARRFLKAGASGYLTKASAPDELIIAIRKVSEGKKYISPTLADMLASSLDQDTDKMPHELLSDREYQIMLMIALGKTPRVISQELSLSVKTVNNYRMRVLEKMNMKSNAEITTYVIDKSLQ